jgi:hypothetical protein
MVKGKKKKNKFLDKERKVWLVSLYTNHVEFNYEASSFENKKEGRGGHWHKKQLEIVKRKSQKY